MWLIGRPVQSENNVLSKMSLKFVRADLEQKYNDVHWMTQKYWLRWAIMWVLSYNLFWIVLYSFGNETTIRYLDFRLDHYRKSVADFREDYSEAHTWQSVLISVEDGGRFYVHPYVFMGWHLIWTLLFTLILVFDRYCCRKPLAIMFEVRTWATFGLMMLDVVVTAFVNPTVTRFLLFVYALLIRVTWIQALWLVSICSGAIVVSGRVASHSFLTSVSVVEFIGTNVVILVASRQMEMNQRLSMYRLWLLKSSNNKSEWEASETSSLKVFDLFPIEEEDDARVYVQDSEYAGSGKGSNCGSHRSSKRQLKSRSILSGKQSNAPSSPNQSQMNDEASVHSFMSAISRYMPSPCGSVANELGLWEHPCEARFIPDGAVNGWSDVLPDKWKFRSQSYFRNGKKEVHALGPLFRLHDMRLFGHHNKLSHCALKIKSLRNFLQLNPDYYFLIINRILPIKHRYYMHISVHVKKRIDFVGPWDALWHRFLTQDDAFRNSSLKYSCDFIEAPFMVKKMVSAVGGARRPVILGHGYLKQEFFHGSNYLEIDIDISSSRVARSITNTVLGLASKCVIEEAFVVEAANDEELPERPLALQCVRKVDFKEVICELDADMLDEFPRRISRISIGSDESQNSTQRDASDVFI